MHDIREYEDIKRLIDTFYASVRSDEVIGHIFNDIAKVDWPHHLPVMYNFWAFMLLDDADAYRGNPMEKHAALHQIYPLKAAHFDRWVALFQAAVDANFSGPTAEKAKFRAFTISETWKAKFDNALLR